MISVIVPVYNVEPYLEEAIESVIHQTYTDLEIILVDDGSTDDSGKICDRYQKKDSRIKVVHQENRGLSAARNAGLDICKGEMIAFLDSDDAFCTDMLQKMSDAMLESGADIVECNYAEYKGVHSMNPQKIRKKRNTSLRKRTEGAFTPRGTLFLCSWTGKLHQLFVINSIIARYGTAFDFPKDKTMRTLTLSCRY